jgi:hypothetical protein
MQTKGLTGLTPEMTAQEVAGSIPAQYKHFMCTWLFVLGLGVFCVQCVCIHKKYISMCTI